MNNSRRTGNCCVNTNEEIDRIVYPMQQISIHQRENEELNLPVLRYQPANLHFVPMPLHRTRGRNVRFNSSRSVATRIDTEFCQGYVFTARPLQLGERIVIQILATEPLFQGCLGLGLTSCDPAILQNSDLPDDSNFLLDRPEYWVLSKDFARNLNVGDEISFCIAPNGEVQISKNGGAPSVVIHVDQTLKLWAFFDVYGSTRRIRVLNCTSTTTPTRNTERRIITPTSNSESMNSLNSQSELRRNSVMHQQSNARVCCVTPADIQVQPSANGGAVLSVILPPSHANIINQQQSQQQQQQQPPLINQHLHHSSQNSIHSSNSSNPSHYPSNNNHPIPTQHIISPIAAQPPLSPTPAIMAPVPSGSTITAPTGTMMSTCSNTYIEV